MKRRQQRLTLRSGWYCLPGTDSTPPFAAQPAAIAALRYTRASHRRCRWQRQPRSRCVRCRSACWLLSYHRRPPLPVHLVVAILSILVVLAPAASPISGESSGYVNLHPYVDAGVYMVSEETTARRVWSLFRSLGMRHIVVVDTRHLPVGMITRRDLIMHAVADR